jgi:hypothetical protein
MWPEYSLGVLTNNGVSIVKMQLSFFGNIPAKA